MIGAGSFLTEFSAEKTFRMDKVWVLNGRGPVLIKNGFSDRVLKSFEEVLVETSTSPMSLLSTNSLSRLGARNSTYYDALLGQIPTS